MFRRVNAGAAIACLSLSAACSGGAVNLGGTSTVPLSHRAGDAVIRPAKNCGGTGGVAVNPCPVRLTRHKKRGIVVTVSGPGVVNSYLGRLTSCFNGQICYNAERVGDSNTQWRITPGASCGTADVEFDGVDSSGAEVGYFFLKVANKYCP